MIEMTEENYAAKCRYRLDRLLTWVGILEPEEVEIEGEKIPVREFVYTLFSKRDKLSSEDIQAAKELLRKLERKKMLDEEKLKQAKAGEEETEILCLEIAGLIRAILTLNDVILEEPREEIKQKIQSHNVQDWRSWLNYLKQIK